MHLPAPVDIASRDATRDRDAPSTVDAVVKWFEPERGFGFVITGTGEPDALLHASTLRRAGLPDPTQGDRLRCVLDTGHRGRVVTSVLAAAAVGAAALGGRVKFFDLSRGYGFVRTDCGQDVFVGAKLLRRLGLTPLRENQAVRVTVRGGERGPVAETLTFPT